MDTLSNEYVSKSRNTEYRALLKFDEKSIAEAPTETNL